MHQVVEGFDIGLLPDAQLNTTALICSACQKVYDQMRGNPSRPPDLEGSCGSLLGQVYLVRCLSSVLTILVGQTVCKPIMINLLEYQVGQLWLTVA